MPGNALHFEKYAPIQIEVYMIIHDIKVYQL